MSIQDFVTQAITTPIHLSDIVGTILYILAFPVSIFLGIFITGVVFRDRNITNK